MAIRLPLRLRQLRKEKNLTQQKLADLLGVPRVTYTHYERGLRTPDLELLMRFADFFQVSLDFLVGYTDIRPSPEAWSADHPRKAHGAQPDLVYQLDTNLPPAIGKVADHDSQGGPSERAGNTEEPQSEH